MNIRAVIFDIYKTLLTVEPPAADAAQQWTTLCRRMLPAQAAELPLAEFGRRCQALIEHEHTTARLRGIPFPEICWPTIVANVIPSLASLPAAQRAEFIFEQIRLWHTVRLAPGAGDVLKRLVRARLPLGLVSNCQPYTMRELDEALATERLRRKIFDPFLCFLSFEHGFSKPDPHVFRLLAARLAARGIRPEEALVVGDREDNDIEPARAQDFPTWLLSETVAGDAAGSWPQLGEHLQKLQ